MLDQIEAMINKEVEFRIKKRDLIPVEHVTNQLKVKYKVLVDLSPTTLEEMITKRELEAEIKGLLLLVESHKFGLIRTDTIAERMENI